MLTILVLLGILIIYAIFLFIVGFLPIFLVNKYKKYQLTRKRLFYTFLYFIYFPISIFFSRSYYNGLKNDGVIENKKGFFKLFLFFFIAGLIFEIGFGVIKTLYIRPYMQPFQVSGQAMAPAIYDREFLLVKRESEYKRGDIITFTPPNKDLIFIKRIIGLPNETIKVEQGKVFLLESETQVFKELSENYLSQESHGKTFIKTSPDAVIYTIPANSYFVLGDNREHSTDSRACFGNCEDENASPYTTLSDISGKAYFDLGYFHFKSGEFIHPEYGFGTKPRGGLKGEFNF